MVIVKLVGGAKKSFDKDQLELDAANITLEKLLELVQELKPQDTPSLDVNNILVAINGADSSAREGLQTVIKNDDLVSIIPVIHGGASKKITIKNGRKLIQVVEIKGDKKIDVTFLENLRKEFPKLKIQAISSKFILNPYHLKKILSISMNSDKENILLSNKLETDILLRFAATTQISDAISSAGIKPKNNFILIAIGTKTTLEKLHRELTPLITDIFQKDNSAFLKKQFKITKKQMDSVYSKNPLEDLLIEKAAVLIG
ncbi:MAG: KEOPS complex subunit Cgi121 [Nitrosopumilaceae archaeon]|jgi:tRNA threonylcarbamoyladenosine modification (KEOPS) complex Cgi121 subunit/molybdopterin converting factor small subunit